MEWASNQKNDRIGNFGSPSWRLLFSNLYEYNPGPYIILHHPIFKGYNRKFGKEEDRELMDFEPLNERRSAFKDAIIYPEIFTGEFKTREFYKWLKCIDDHAYDFKYIFE